MNGDLCHEQQDYANYAEDRVEAGQREPQRL